MDAVNRQIMGHLLRLLQSLLVDPASTEGHGDIRDYLRRWLTPAIEGLPEAHRRRAVGSEM